MSLNLNKVVIGGRLTADVELKHTQSGTAVCGFTIAVDRKYKKENEEKQTDFISVVAWRHSAEFISKYFRKGSSICITGSIQTRTWNDKNGQKRYASEVVVDEAYFVDGKTSSSSSDITNSSIQADYQELNNDSDLPF